MQRLTTAAVALLTIFTVPAFAQQDNQKALQSEADKGIKTQNSGASGIVGEQEKSGSAARVPGSSTDTGSAANAPSAQNPAPVSPARPATRMARRLERLLGRPPKISLCSNKTPPV